MKYVWLNSELKSASQALIAVDDRGFSLGDGLFETLKVTAGKPELFTEHLVRLRRSAKVLGLTLSADSAEIKQSCLILLAKNNLQTNSAALRITLTRGVSGRGIDIDKAAGASLLITAVPYNPPVTPLRLIISSIKRSSFSVCSHHKTLNYLENILAREEAKSAGFDDALLLNEKDEVVCATAANIFFKKDDVIVTPALNCGALPGVMRQAVIDDYKNKGIIVSEKIIKHDELKEFNGCFITNSLIGKREVDL